MFERFVRSRTRTGFTIRYVTRAVNMHQSANDSIKQPDGIPCSMVVAENIAIKCWLAGHYVGAIDKLHIRYICIGPMYAYSLSRLSRDGVRINAMLYEK